MALNILLIVVDCLRADHISYYGYDKPTPNIDALARKSTVYRNAWSPGGCTSQSIPYILSEYLYEVLRREGYKAPIVVHSSPRVSLYLKRRKKYLNVDIHTVSRLSRLFHWLKYGIYNEEARAPKINKIARAIMGTTTPFFLCVWYMDAHNPFLPPGETGIRDLLLAHRHLKAIGKEIKLTPKEIDRLIYLYDREIAYFDRNLNGLLEAVPEDTIIIFTSDHGEEFNEAGDIGHQNKDIPALRQVPLFIYDPRGNPQNNTWGDMRTLDLMIEGLI